MRNHPSITTRLRTALLALLLLTAFVPASRAQVQEVLSEFQAGLTMGYNMASASFSPTVRQKNLGGMDVGIAGRYICERYFKMTCGVQMEVNYSQWGWKEFYKDYPDLAYSARHNYVSVPFMAHMAFGKPTGFQFFLHLGPQVGFHLSDSYSIDGPWDEHPELVTEQHGKGVENRFDYGIIGGAGFEMHLGRSSMMLEGRFYYALADFYRTTKLNYFGRAAHMAISVRATWFYSL